MPLVKEQQYKNWFLEIETDDGLKGHALGGDSVISALRELSNSEMYDASEYESLEARGVSAPACPGPPHVNASRACGDAR
jgi:hypothetical protein